MKVILVSGWGTGHEVWEPVASKLPRYDVACVPWWDCLESDEFAEPGAVVGGWSLGALVALRAARSVPVAGLVLVSGTARFTSDDGYAGADPRALRAMAMWLGRQPERVLADFAALCTHDAAFQESFTERALSIGVERLAAGLACLGETDLRARLGEITVPTLVIHGEADAVIPLASARTVVEGLPDAREVVLPGAPHALPHASPGRLVDEIGRFADAL